MMRNLGIYIHIPFCVSKCAYCDFFSAPADEGVREKYAAALVRQIKENTLVNPADYRVVSVFLGGGTPSILSCGMMRDILAAVRESYALTDDCEITIECNPGTVDEDKLRTYMELGVNRLSFGLQSVNDDELAALGRIHTFRDFLDSYELARKTGFDNINVDLISAIPGQTISSWLKTLETVVKLGTKHISAYSLIMEEGTPLYERYKRGEELKLPDEEEERAIYYLTGEYLEKAGFHRYEISNYAREGFECRHNKLYWKRVPYVGFGAGASSFINDVRYDGIRDMKLYTANPVNAFGTPEIVSTKDAMAEFMYLGLRLTEGVRREDFALQFGKSLDEVYGEIVKKYVSSGHMTDEGSNIRLTPKGTDVSNYIFSDFLQD